MKRVLVTGATGCVGRGMLPELVGRGWDVHAISSRPMSTSGPRVTWHQADLMVRQQVRAAIRRADASHLVHLAWHLPPGRWAGASENFAWVQASLALLETFREHEGIRIVTAGSCLEYDWNYGYCSETRTPCVPTTTYGACKHALQILTAAFASSHGMTSAWGRIFNLYGPYEHPDRLVPAVVRSLLVGEPARCSHGEQIRDYLYSADVASALAALLESDLTGPINIGSGEPIRLKEIVTEIGAQLGRSDLIHLGAIPPATTDVPVVVADVTRLRGALGWRPQHDLARGLALTIEWCRTNVLPLVEKQS